MEHTSVKCISQKRCVIGEGPTWNEKEKLLYFTNGGGNEICMLDIYTGALNVRPVEVGIAAFCFDASNRLIVSRCDGVFYLNPDDTIEPIYDTETYQIPFANDMKVGPDGSIYVGTLGGKRAGVSEKKDGKLYRIDKNGSVSCLLDGLLLSNGLDWSIDETKFYHTDSDTRLLREYDYNKENGTISFTGRELEIIGIDGLTVDSSGNILTTKWGEGIAVVDPLSFRIKEIIPIPANSPASCAFCGNDMEFLAVVTSSSGADITKDKNAGFTFLCEHAKGGRKPYIFGR